MPWLYVEVFNRHLIHAAPVYPAVIGTYWNGNINCDQLLKGMVCPQVGVPLTKMSVSVFHAIISTFVYTATFDFIWWSIEDNRCLQKPNQIKLVFHICFIFFYGLTPLINSFQEQVFNQMSMLWDRYRGEWIPSKRKLMHDIPLALQQDIIMEDMENIVQNAPIFRDLDESFLRVACSKMDPYMFAPGDVIVYAGVLCREMVFVRRGLCQIISPDAVHLAEIGPGQYFGVIAMLFGQYQKASLIAKTHVEILQLSLHDYNVALTDFPLLAEQMKKLKRNIDYVKKAQNKMLANMDKQAKETLAQCKGRPPKVATKYSNTGIEFHKRKPVNVKTFKRTKPDGTPNEDYLEPFMKRSKFVQLLCLIFLMKRTFIPQSTLVKIWAYMMFTLSLIVSLTIPLQLAFLYHDLNLWVVHGVIDFISLCNIYFSLHMAFLNNHGVLITHPLPCALHYLKTTFVLDLLSCIPGELIYIGLAYGNEELDAQIIAVIRATRLFMCYRIPFVFSYFESNIQKATGKIRFVKFFMYMMIFENALTCILFIFVCIPRRFHAQDSVNGYRDIGKHRCLPESWLIDSLEKKVFTEESDLVLYTISFYWATATTISVGYGDISATSPVEMVVASVAMILGIFFFWLHCC